MLNIFKNKPQGTTITFKINGMHCTSCSMNIDGELEDTTGVISASTSYAKATTTIEYDSSKINPNQLKKIILQLGYKVEKARKLTAN